MDLSNVRILDFTRLLPGPFATQLLADLGADVIKVEDPARGDYARNLPPLSERGIGATFETVNRGKRSLAIDLKSDAGQETLADVLEAVDVVFEGFRPGVAERLGIDPETVREVEPDIIYCSLTGYGRTGPLSQMVGHDLNYVGHAGLLDMTREGPDGDPQIPGYPIADMAGGLFCAFAVMAGLLSRELGGGGATIDVGMSEVVTAFAQQLVPSVLAGEEPRPGATRLTGRLPWYDVYEAKDGEFLTVAALEPQFWEAFCEAVGREDLIEYHGTTDPAELEALRGELSELFASKPRDRWLAILQDVDSATGPVLTLEDWLDHPQSRVRELVVGEEASDGARAPRIGFPGLVDGVRPTEEGSLPALGEDSRAVLRELGIRPERIDELVAAGVVADSPD